MIATGKTSFLINLKESIFISCVVYNAFNITWFHGNNRVQPGPKYYIYKSTGPGTNVSLLKVMDIDCQVAGNYTCAAANDYGSDQRQFTLTIIGKSVSKQFNIGLLVETK